MKKYILLAAVCLPATSYAGNPGYGARETDFETLLDDNKVWEYVHTSKYSEEGPQDFYLLQYSVTGEVVKNDKTYKTIARTGYKGWRETYAADGSLSVVQLDDYPFVEPSMVDNSLHPFDAPNSPNGVKANANESEQHLYLMREENGKVYILVEDWEMLYYDPYDSKSDNRIEIFKVEENNPREFLVYDFTSGKNDIISNYVRFADCLLVMNVCEATYSQVDDIIPVETLQGNRNKFYLTHQSYEVSDIPMAYSFTPGPDHKEQYYTQYVEGVGSVAGGFLFAPGGLNIAPRNLGEEIISEIVVFNNMYDKNGNVLYAGYGVTKPETGAVSQIEDSGNRDSDKTYDIMGREVNATVPGSVYIRNGKKFIGK